MGNLEKKAPDRDAVWLSGDAPSTMHDAQQVGHALS
jgi:hypothetical protein